jgi:hypothetical protein
LGVFLDQSHTVTSCRFVRFSCTRFIEEEVYQSLADKLGIKNLIPQLLAGFRIDIVYLPKGMGFLKLQLNVMVARNIIQSRNLFTTDTDKKH